MKNHKHVRNPSFSVDLRKADTNERSDTIYEHTQLCYTVSAKGLVSWRKITSITLAHQIASEKTRMHERSCASRIYTFLPSSQREKVKFYHYCCLAVREMRLQPSKCITRNGKVAHAEHSFQIWRDHSAWWVVRHEPLPNLLWSGRSGKWSFWESVSVRLPNSARTKRHADHKQTQHNCDARRIDRVQIFIRRQRFACRCDSTWQLIGRIWRRWSCPNV